MKNKKTLIIAIVAVVVILGGATAYILSSRQTASKTSEEPGIEMETIPTISAKDIGLTLEIGDDGQRVIMKIAKTSDITGVDYELSYTSKGDIPRGAIGHVDVKEEGKTISQEIVLGTCSDVCHYDQEVANIKLVAKITKTDGKIYQSEVNLD